MGLHFNFLYAYLALYRNSETGRTEQFFGDKKQSSKNVRKSIVWVEKRKLGYQKTAFQTIYGKSEAVGKYFCSIHSILYPKHLPLTTETRGSADKRNSFVEEQNNFQNKLSLPHEEQTRRSADGTLEVRKQKDSKKLHINHSNSPHY
mgnify:CR=1 FL=1